MNKKITRDILSGMYVASTIDSACIVDTVLQVSSTEPPLISVCINKNNYTNEKIKEHQKFAISILGMDTKGDVIKTFGFNTSREIDKFEKIEYLEIDGVKVLKDSLGYMMCEVVDIIDTETHNIFIGKIIKMERFKTELPMSYQYYQEHKDDLIETRTEKGQKAWVCTICGYVYYGEELPDDFICPICRFSKDVFELEE